ncbi:MAG: 50S ribosomal protein L9 [Candidatus Staskawiczbacteria bacterium RIFOXYB2_FULL_32_9]|uniref:Large ribosomal subunit protein bL9 n=1 Tax=Candidatus Staskawiczbacteria bacterium RIFOXYD1_FULL_32_13 TaxID=1802234 RepID=A0A1G2JRF7_9BACT|nr:MAG: 50S ribosomal protein L9 [Parcubacteria group bacterium GW2011_GWC2_32_10]OGZ78619.1 MAG: 50S ribosomal protein L9 [Candidatus Staskawiczbacteria bacterium RIFOXYA2_FULL_32_7]OGZ79818.1 MAG: 50S ribosomal protein L9 [Candidatus Staskawiczbacteria bacterium RIFOXYB1_FULL_32_11]OGZ81046.1 MAG: 50S ribosomal protein L9 [Candidatus Staskawiczbacteria bacterium RIFOXYB2_FULL_32_9]OGZ89662.1 MAG: 50S ribosomal protein L9 [Candidatus Staskawiczbacteria bacterium RIFOXYD1_FULL_32_13]
MKVILMQNVEDVGKKYEVKEVKDGYARNFLIVKKLAKPATKQALKWLDSQKENIEKEVEEELKKFQELASNLDDLEVQITLKVGDEGQLFESVNAQKIVEKLKEMGFDVKKSQIDLQEAIKQTGEFKVKINLEHNLEAEINLSILPEDGGIKEEI